MFKVICIYLCLALLSTYKIAEEILSDRKRRKSSRILLWWILAADAVIFLEHNCFGLELSNLGAIFILIGFIYLMVISINYILKDRDLINKIGLFAGWFGVLFVLSFSLVKISIIFMYFFKILIMFMLLMGLLIIKNAPPIVKIVMAIIFYLGMVAIDVVLTTGFLFSTIDEAVKAIYEVFQRIYCLNPLGKDYQKEELVTAIAGFLMCRIMDVILLGFLSSTFIEICNSRTKNQSCNSKECDCSNLG